MTLILLYRRLRAIDPQCGLQDDDRLHECMKEQRAAAYDFFTNIAEQVHGQ